MNILFDYVIQATTFATVVGTIIFTLKSTVLRKLSAKWQYLLWSVMIVKLIFPKGPESRISVFNKFNIVQKVSEADLISVAQKPEPTTKLMVYTPKIFEFTHYIWFTVFMIFMLCTIISYAVLKHKIHISSSAPSESTQEILKRCKEITGVQKNIKIVVQNHVPTTSLYGIVQPRILITKDFEKSDISHIEYTFMHELSHYKRGDIAVGYMLLFLRCVHWFNPAIWFLIGKIRRDAELATDERTMLYLNPNEHKSYGMALINTLSVQPAKAPKLLGMANNKHDITKRIKAIAKFKKPGFIHNISGIMTMLLIASICLTSAAVAKPVAEKIIETVPKVSTALKTGKPVTETVVPIKEHKTDDTINDQKTTESQQATEVQQRSNNDTYAEYENFENRNIDTLICRTGQVIDNGNGTTDLNKNAKLLHYNTDYDGTYSFTVKPNSLGYIQFFVENEGYDHSVYIGISNVETKGFGWDYCFSTEGNAPIYLDGYEPEEEYFVTVYCYCPGHYDINGRILIY